jgi:hypothetical protein
MRLLLSCSIIVLVTACLQLDSPEPSTVQKEQSFADSGAATTKDSKTGTDPPSPGQDGQDAGAGADAGGVRDVFADVPAHKGAQPATTANSRHLGSVAGRDCNGCHGHIAVPFHFAGTAYDAQGAPAAGAEVRVVDADGKEVGFATSDADGNFWSELRTPNLGTPKIAGKTAIRTAKGVMQMSAAISAGGCNAAACHDDKRRIVVP